MTRRGKTLLLSLAVVLVSGGLAAAVLSSRTIEGSIPGSATILSLAAPPDGLLAGTEQGLYASPDGKRWARVPRFGTSRVVVKGETGGALLGQGDHLYATGGLASFQDLGGLRSDETDSDLGSVAAVASGDQRTIAVTTTGRVFLRFEGLLIAPLEAVLPRGVLSVAAGGGKIYAGGLGIGLWLSEDDGVSWRQVLATPVASVEIDSNDESRVFLGTPGGLLVSDPEKTWRFTELRIQVDALAYGDGEFFAVSDRIVYRSRDGDSGWRAIPAREAESQRVRK